MAAALIRIDQATNASPIGVAGRSRDDIDLGAVVQLRNANDTGVRSWRWSLVDRPAGSAAALSSPVDAAPTFTPDVVGSYLIQLVVNDGHTGELDRRIVACRDDLGLRMPAAGESDEANWLIGGSPNTRGYQPEFEQLRTVVEDHEALITDLQTQADDLDVSVVRDIDFTAVGSGTIVDGANTIGGLSWLGANIASRTTSAAWSASGIALAHVNGSTSSLAGADTAPRISIALSSLVPDYNPLRRYFFVVTFSWSATPNENGERFAVGFYAAATAPWPSSALRFGGVCNSYNSTAGAPTVTMERDNTILNTQSPTALTIGVSLEGMTTLSGWKANAMPSDPSGLTPVATQRETNLTAGGNYNIFHHPDVRFAMGLAATGATATHGVLITRLRIFRA